VPPRSQPELSESQARRASALKSALGPLTDLLDDPRVVEVMLNADGLRTSPGGERPRAEVLVGAPRECGKGTLGPIARFESGQVVAYRIRGRRRRRLFVFRTLEVDDALAVAVPGTRPRVQLLMELRTEGRIRLVRSLFAYLARTGWDPSALPDAFYTRVSALLGGRLPGHKILPLLLSAYRPKPTRARAKRTVRGGPRGADR
jgi:hypothetical protein